MIRGFDASSAQGTIPFEKLSNDLKFGIFKAQQGNDGFDPFFFTNVKKAQDHGIIPGAYFFDYPIRTNDPKKQAQKFFEASKGFGASKGELPPFIDLEWPEVVPSKPGGKGWKEWNVTPQSISDHSEILAEEMTSLWGVEPVIYFYEWWWDCVAKGAPAYGFPIGADVSWAGKYEAWFAHYINRWPADDEAFPKPPAPWTETRWWQCDGNGGLKLPNGGDADFCVFNGTMDDLNALADGPRTRDIADFDIVHPDVELS